MSNKFEEEFDIMVQFKLIEIDEDKTRASKTGQVYYKPTIMGKEFFSHKNSPVNKRN